MWDGHTGALLSTLQGHTDFIQSLAFSPDGKIVASASGIPWFFLYTSGDRTIRLWRVSDGKSLTIFTKAHDGIIPGLAFSPDGHTLSSGSVDGTIRFWQIGP